MFHTLLGKSFHPFLPCLVAPSRSHLLIPLFGCFPSPVLNPSCLQKLCQACRNSVPPSAVTVLAPETMTPAPPPLSDTTFFLIAKVRAQSSPLPVPPRQHITPILAWNSTSCHLSFMSSWIQGHSSTPHQICHHWFKPCYPRLGYFPA